MDALWDSLLTHLDACLVLVKVFNYKKTDCKYLVIVSYMSSFAVNRFLFEKVIGFWIEGDCIQYSHFAILFGYTKTLYKCISCYVSLFSEYTSENPNYYHNFCFDAFHCTFASTECFFFFFLNDVHMDYV